MTSPTPWTVPNPAQRRTQNTGVGGGMPTMVPSRTATPAPPVTAGPAANPGSVNSGGPLDQYENAMAVLNSTLQSWGLSDLAPTVLEYLKKGLSKDAILDLLPTTPDYQKRFAGNEVRKKAGLPVLSPAEYLATEDGYRQIMRDSGLPKGFYDTREDYASLIGMGVSPAEVQRRVKSASDVVLSKDPTVRQQLRDYYGVDDRHLAAYFLDPQRAEPILNRQVAASQLGAAAARQGYQVDKDRAEFLSQTTVGGADPSQAYEKVAQVLPTTRKLGGIYGQQYTQTDAENDQIAGLASAQRKRESLERMEQGQFAGRSGGSAATLGDTLAGF